MQTADDIAAEDRVEVKDSRIVFCESTFGKLLSFWGWGWGLNFPTG
jgi:hypothetical protein